MQIIKGNAGFFASVEASLDSIDPNWKGYNGLIITGSHAPKDFDLPRVMEEIRQARESGTPTLGICFGLQLMAIEYARNALNYPNANSEEIDPQASPLVVAKLPGFRTGIYPVGQRPESHWHQYAINPHFIAQLGPHFRMTKTGDIVEMMWLWPEEKHFYLGVQFHPEYQSSKDNPHPVLLEFIKRCKK